MIKLSFEEYLRKEQRLKTLDTYTIFDNIPIWRIVRTRIRGEFINSPDKTIGAKITPKLLVNVLISFIQLSNIIIKRKRVNNIIFSHPRLFKVEGKYIERLSDPVIDYSDIKYSYIIFERWQNGIHKKPRVHQEKCKYWDFIPFISLIISKLFSQIIVKKYKNQIKELISELSLEFEISEKIKSEIIRELSNFIISYRLAYPILNACSAKRVFVAPRSTFNYIIAYGKKHDVTSYELQHGITLGQTKLYSGVYHNDFDPDYFLTFGKGNISNYFGMPIDKIINIGYAYGHYITNMQKENLTHSNRILVISDPQITEPLLKTVLLFAKKHPEWEFDFRCHPQEALNLYQKNIIRNQSNIHEVDNDGESFLTINKYPIVIGENSSVLFEAMFLNKKVGRLNFNGLNVALDSKIQGGFIINSIDDFDIFIKESNLIGHNYPLLYSEFESKTVNNLK